MKTINAASPKALRALTRALGDVGDGAPRYRQLRDALLATIEAGHWKVGDRLPTESELCRVVPLSLGTIQRALRALVDEGVVMRVQGSGTFVASAHAKIDDVAHCRFLADDGKSYLPVFSHVVSRKPASTRGPWTQHLARSGARPVRLDRILSVNGEFNVYSRFYFDAARFASLATRPYEELAGVNLKELLRDELHVARIELEQTFRIARIPRGIEGHIGVATDSIGGILEGVGRARDQGALYFLQMFFPPSQRRWVPAGGAPSA